MMAEVIFAHALVAVIGLITGFMFSDGKPGLSKVEYRLAGILAIFAIAIQWFLGQGFSETTLHLIIGGVLLYVGVYYGDITRRIVDTHLVGFMNLSKDQNDIGKFIQTLNFIVQDLQHTPHAIENFRLDFLANYENMKNLIGRIENVARFVNDAELLELCEKTREVVDKFYVVFSSGAVTLEQLRNMKPPVQDLQKLLENLIGFVQKRYEQYRSQVLQLFTIFIKKQAAEKRAS